MCTRDRWNIFRDVSAGEWKTTDKKKGVGVCRTIPVSYTHLLIDDGRIEEAKTVLKESYQKNPDELNAFYEVFIKEKIGRAHV